MAIIPQLEEIPPMTKVSPVSNLRRRHCMEQALTKRRNVGVPKFLRFLYDILQKEDKNIICWSHKGTAFQVRRPDALANTILPRYFKHNKVSSFQRQLNYFGFKKWTKTQTQVCTFSHPHFLRSDPDKIRFIKRKERGSTSAEESPVHKKTCTKSFMLPALRCSSTSSKPSPTISPCMKERETSVFAVEPMQWDDMPSILFSVEADPVTARLELKDWRKLDMDDASTWDESTEICVLNAEDMLIDDYSLIEKDLLF